MTDNAKELLALARIARAFLAHFNPTQLAEDASQQWQALEHECEKAERLSARQQASVELLALKLAELQGNTETAHDDDAHALLAKYDIFEKVEG